MIIAAKSNRQTCSPGGPGGPGGPYSETVRKGKKNKTSFEDSWKKKKQIKNNKQNETT